MISIIVLYVSFSCPSPDFDLALILNLILFSTREEANQPEIYITYDPSTSIFPRTSWVPIFLGVPRALCWVLFSSSYILLTFPLSFQNIRLLVISLLTTFRHMFMVLLLVNFFSPAKLNYSQMILILGCPQIDSL